MGEVRIKMLKTYTDNGIKYGNGYLYTLPSPFANKLITEGIGELFLEPEEVQIPVSEEIPVTIPVEVVYEAEQVTIGDTAKKNTRKRRRKL